MKLKKLHIENYKNLKDFVLDFENDNGLSILVGNNGSGKSNILEAISGIFCEWYGKVKYTFPCDYSISYEIDNHQIKLFKKENKLTRQIDYIDYSVKNPKNNPIFLPSNVIALYSGEDLRLWENMYMPTYLRYFKDHIAGQTGRMGMYYVNKYLWNISLFTMLLFSSDLTDIADFLKDEIGIKNVDTDVLNVLISFDFKKYAKNNNSIVKSFIDRINPEHLSEIRNSLGDWKSIITDFNDSNQVYNLLMQAFMPKKYKIITNIEIVFNNGLTLESLSEGEKKLILTKSVLEFVADENSILLLDEPDANIHEARKFALYNLLKKYNNRQTIITSHSPSLVKNADSNELKYLENKNGKTTVITDDKLELIKKLASDQWNIVEAGVYLNSEKTLILVEGKSDIAFIKQAIDFFKNEKEVYKTFDFDFLSFNGTGNALAFVEKIRLISPAKPILIIFDRDGGGKDGMVHISGRKKDSEDIENFKDYISSDGKIKAFFYPYTADVCNEKGNFLVEDYFPQAVIENIVNRSINYAHPFTKNLNFKLEEKIKNYLEQNYKSYPKEDFEGFKVLLDKIYEMTKE